MTDNEQTANRSNALEIAKNTIPPLIDGWIENLKTHLESLRLPYVDAPSSESDWSEDYMRMPWGGVMAPFSLGAFARPRSWGNRYMTMVRNRVAAAISAEHPIVNGDVLDHLITGRAVKPHASLKVLELEGDVELSTAYDRLVIEVLRGTGHLYYRPTDFMDARLDFDAEIRAGALPELIGVAAIEIEHLHAYCPMLMVYGERDRAGMEGSLAAISFQLPDKETTRFLSFRVAAFALNGVKNIETQHASILNALIQHRGTTTAQILEDGPSDGVVEAEAIFDAQLARIEETIHGIRNDPRYIRSAALLKEVQSVADIINRTLEANLSEDVRGLAPKEEEIAAARGAMSRGDGVEHYLKALIDLIDLLEAREAAKAAQEEAVTDTPE